jgi:hypothetical protein
LKGDGQYPAASPSEAEGSISNPLDAEPHQAGMVIGRALQFVAKRADRLGMARLDDLHRLGRNEGLPEKTFTLLCQEHFFRRLSLGAPQQLGKLAREAGVANVGTRRADFEPLAETSQFSRDFPGCGLFLKDPHDLIENNIQSPLVCPTAEQTLDVLRQPRQRLLK